MSTTLDFQIQPLSAEAYSLTVCERDSSQPLASATFSHRVNFLTGFSVDRLNASNNMGKDAAERFDEFRKIGAQLYLKLFPPAVEQVWNDYKQRSEFLILCLRISPEAAELEVLPWETLHDGIEFITAGVKTTLTRLPLDVEPQNDLPLIPRPLRLFAFFASPLDLKDNERLNVEREQEILLEAINDPAGQGRISADFEDEATLEILARSLRDGYHIFHFTGHSIGPRDGGGLLLEDAQGRKLPASIPEVVQAVKSGADKLRLAVISGCQTARTLHTGAFSDLARELLRQRVPAVIAMQFSISDEGGLKFAEVLYREIAKGVELERAVHAARRVLLADERFFINNDALAIVLLAADGACLQTTEAQSLPSQAEPGATYLGDRLDPLAHGFYGRRREYRKIRDGLQQDQRAVIIHGIGGIGKTALLTHAINRLRPRFKDVMSFDCRRAALAPETILLELHRYFATQGMPQLQSLIGQNVPPETLADEIARMLEEWPLLIVFDNFESQLDERREFINEDLCVFLTALVRATATGSRFLFTTRYLFDLDGERLGNLQELPLGDLSRAEALMLMQKLPNLAQAAYRDKLAVLEKFGGHPYALVTLDRHCSHQPLDQALQDANSLESELREFLAIELNYRRLSDLTRELLNRLAAFRIGVPFATVEWVMGEKIALTAEDFQTMRDGMPEQFKATDDATLQQIFEETLPERRPACSVDEPTRELIDWGLLTPHHENGALQALSVHSLVRDFCRDQQQSDNWRGRLRDAAVFYTDQTKLLREYDKTVTAVCGEMEAIELLMEAENFSGAAELLTKVHPILNRWGYGRYLESQYRCLLDKLDQSNIAVTRNNLGLLLEGHGNYDSALKQYQLSLKIAEELSDHVGIGRSLLQIGTIHRDRGDYDAALEQQQLSLKIAEELEDPAILARTLHQFGIILQDCGDYDAALKQYQLSLKIMKELDDRAGCAASLYNIGTLHYLLGDYGAALEHYQFSLKIVGEPGDYATLARTLHQVGMILQDRGDYEAALKQYQLSLKIVEELGDRTGIASTLHQIGTLHYLCEDYDAALEQYQLSLKIAEEIGNRAGIASSLHQVGMIHQGRGDYDAALEQYQLSLDIIEELGDHAGIASSVNQIGRVLTETGHYADAFRHLFSALSTFTELQSPRKRITATSLRILRAKWGEQEFDAAWQEATNEEVPEWLKGELEDTGS